MAAFQRVLGAETIPHVLEPLELFAPDRKQLRAFLLAETTAIANDDGVITFFARGSFFTVFPSGLMITSFGASWEKLHQAVRDQGHKTVDEQQRHNRELCKPLWTDPAIAGPYRAINMVNWLLTIRGVVTPENEQPEPWYSWAIPVCVTPIKNPKAQRFGAIYERHEKFQATERAVFEGGMTAGSSYYDYCMYLHGSRWVVDGHTDRLVFKYMFNERQHPLAVCHDETDEWYLACYRDERNGFATSLYQQFISAPFGPSFILRQHEKMNFGPYAGHDIDTIEHKAYTRVPVLVEKFTLPSVGEAQMEFT